MDDHTGDNAGALLVVQQHDPMQHSGTDTLWHKALRPWPLLPDPCLLAV